MARLDGFDARLTQEIAGIVAGVRDWRAQHPRATFAEMETELDRRFNAARARVLGELAHASEAADLSGRPAGERARCPDCGAELRPLGKKGRTVLTQGGEPVRLARDWAVCPGCGRGLFPPR